jgi:hypothetical protein
MKSFKLNEEFQVVCEFVKTRSAFKHVAKVLQNGHQVYETKICYQNRTWEAFEFQSVLHKAIDGYFDKDDAQKYRDIVDGKGSDDSKHAFDPVKAICALGNIMCEGADEKAKWNKRMIGTIPGIDFPEGFDELPAEEREKKLAGALEIL